MPERIIGEVTPFPGAESVDIQQLAGDTCAVKSQQIIMKAFGVDIPEEVLTNESAIKGYYMPGVGSDPAQVGQLLNDHGIATHSMEGANVYDLVNELAQGHKVIVGVDSDELWRPSFFNDLFGEEANHALVVTGIDTTDPNNVKVLVTDPGNGDVIQSYGLEQFMDAWHDSNCMMVATNQAPPAIYAPTMINFDYGLGHLPMIGDIPFEQYQTVIYPEMSSFFDHATLHDPILQPQDIANIYDQMHEAISVWNSTEDFHSLLYDAGC